jgi:hypothetical protein
LPYGTTTLGRRKKKWYAKKGASTVWRTPKAIMRGIKDKMSALLDVIEWRK